MDAFLGLLGCVILVLSGSALLLGTRSRTPVDVVIDLAEEGPQAGGGPTARKSSAKAQAPVATGTQAALLGGSGAALVGWLAGLAPGQVAVFAAVGGGAGYLVIQALSRRSKERLRQNYIFHLPLVMESIVMAVEAGADVLGAIGRVVKLEDDSMSRVSIDPVTSLLGVALERVEQGAGLEETLRELGAECEVTAVRHAFLHLALAHREGGELVQPLRELGNSTQVFFQETVEEEIAKLPVRATAPLLCMFTGLIICFVTVPLLQVSSMTKRALPERVLPPLSGERGSMTLFVLFFVFPILYLLATLSLDLRAATIETSARQRVLDEAVLAGVRGMPRPEAARDFTRQYLNRFGFTAEAAVRASASTVSVTVEGVTKLSFPSLLGVDAGVPYTLHARARARPVDAVIALDLGAYLAPTESGFTAWGAGSEWGAAEYFVRIADRFVPPADPRLSTARCFNFTVSALKRAAIGAHDYLGAFSDSRIGLGLFPGDGLPLQFVRSFDATGDTVADLPTYATRTVTADDCAAAAVEERWFEQYRFPGNPYRNGSPPEEGLGWGEAGAAAPRTVGAAVWMSPVREVSPVSNGVGDFGAVLEGVLSVLLGAPAADGRGGFSLNPRRLGLILMGDLPHVGGVRFPSEEVSERIDSILETFRPMIVEHQRRVAIYVVILPAPGRELDSFERQALDQYFTSREVRAAELLLDIEPIFPSDPEALRDSILPAILIDRSGGGIAR